MDRTENIKEQFINDTKNHGIEILHDDGLYRHLKFTNNGSQIYRFDLVTWPGHLAIAGDCGEYTFSRISDMFEFFRGEDFSINPFYWGEKLDSICRNGGYEEFSQEKFIGEIWAWFDDFEFDDDSDNEMTAEQVKESVREEIEIEIIGYSDDGEIRAFDAALSFESSYGHKFDDFWEVDCKEYTCHFLWCLHAIVWGINRYDEFKSIDK